MNTWLVTLWLGSKEIWSVGGINGSDSDDILKTNACVDSHSQQTALNE